MNLERSHEGERVEVARGGHAASTCSACSDARKRCLGNYPSGALGRWREEKKKKE